MSFNDHRENAIAERKAGAEKVEARIRNEIGDIAQLEWSNLIRSGETYHLTVIVGLAEGRPARRTFGFSDEGLSDYPSGTAPKVEEVIAQAIKWIKAQDR